MNLDQSTRYIGKCLDCLAVWINVPIHEPRLCEDCLATPQRCTVCGRSTATLTQHPSGHDLLCGDCCERYSPETLRRRIKRQVVDEFELFFL